jgi:dihydrofolate synthase/folylpolyglutamate synthase
LNFQDAVEYLYQQLPMFHRIGAAAYKANLDNINELSELLNHPEKKFKSVHIAGTNGKGSVSNMIASIFKEAGYKTGLFTSPHLKDFRERIRVDGKMIGEDVIISFIEKYKNEFERIKPSFFEWTTAIAFNYFANENVEVAIIETGLGGRLDSTNIIAPELSVITNISFDHMYLLGDTLTKIASEKAGIIKNSIPVVIGERQESVSDVFIQKAFETESEIIFASDNYLAERISNSDDEQSFRIERNGKLFISEMKCLQGYYQEKNICTVLQSIELLKNKFEKLNDESIVAGIENVIINTGLQGRWQVLSIEPLIIADVAHNEAGLKLVLKQVNDRMIQQRKKHKDSKLHLVFGMVNDKDPVKVLYLLPKDAQYYFCKANIPRSLDEKELKFMAAEFFLKGECYDSVLSALNAAKHSSGKNDIIFIGGSTFIVAEVIG